VARVGRVRPRVSALRRPEFSRTYRFFISVRMPVD
jgi:hypothetical protein